MWLDLQVEKTYIDAKSYEIMAKHTHAHVSMLAQEKYE